MPHLEHDMDELFQKAAENYPLKTGESNWEAIAGRLKDEPVVFNKPARSTNNLKKYLCAVLLLLVALLLTNIILIQKNSGHNIGNINKRKKELEQANSQIQSIPAAVENKIISKNSSSSLKKVYQKDDRSKNYFSETINEITLVNENSYWQPLKIEHEIIEPINTQSYLLSIKNRNTPVLSIKNTVGFTEEKRFYWGILAGPQLNEVKQQGIQHTDLDAGILAGYRISQKLAVESGLFYGKKCYYSDAKYFKMSPDPSMPANMVLMDLEGNSSVIGIPVKLRYDFINKRNTKFFTTAGFASYLLTKENNNYHAMVNGSENFMEKSYTKNSCYVAANVNVSAGFEHRIVRDNFIRVEPYLQIPIKGIGVGSMPVTSAGIHIGIITNKRKR